MKRRKLLTEPQLAKRQAKATAKRQAREDAIPKIEPICCECGELAERVKGDAIYPHRADLHPKSFFLCRCGAYVGCHPFTRIPLGRPAGAATRAARSDAHRLFDALWRRKMARERCDKRTARGAAYRWLAVQLGYEQGQCHIAWMTAEEARAVVRLCLPYVEGQAA